MRVSTLFQRVLPLVAALFAMAAEDDCNIRIDVDDEDEEEECADLGDICPSLSCENGNVLDADGCAICECNTVSTCDQGAVDQVPECANPIFDETTCSWTCGGDVCFSDFDCGPGFFCAFTGADGNGDRADPIAGGQCLPINQGCNSDEECGPGFICDFSGANGGGAEPPRDGEERPGDAPAPPPQGQCVFVDQGCFSDADCGRGFVCEFADAAGGLVAQAGVCVQQTEGCSVDEDCGEGRHCEILDNAGAIAIFVGPGICVDNEPVACRDDSQCAPGERCVETCGFDPTCPDCDRCLLVTVCEPAFVSCTSDAECREGEVCSIDGTSGGANDRAIPCFDENNDGQCDDISATGTCIPVIVDNSCETDADCAEGQFCNGGVDICACTTECRDDGMGGCLPCECPVGLGFCEDISTNTNCISDSDCADGTVCEIIGVTGCEDVPCEVGPDGTMECRPCDPIPVGICVAPVANCFSDADCAADEQCVLQNVCDPATGEACRPGFAPQGTCEPRPATSCSSDADCAAGQLCDAADACLAPPNCNPGEACPDVCFGTCFDPRDQP